MGRWLIRPLIITLLTFLGITPSVFVLTKGPDDLAGRILMTATCD